MSSTRAAALAAFALALACNPIIPDDTFSCDVTADCPAGFTCRDGFCRAGECASDGGCSCAIGATRDCPDGSSEGECTPGTQTCTPDGEWSECVGAVVATTEVCNGLDDDCDGAPDGLVAATSCPDVLRAAMRSCSAGNCVITGCSSGWSDCDATYDNGCEAELGTLDHCGACGDTCGWDCVSSSCNDVVAIEAGSSHSCAVRASGDVVCWGDNTNNQLGNGTTANSLTPVVVSGLSSVTAISVGGSHTCALLSSGALRCWGRGMEGQLGDAAAMDRGTPITPNGLSSGVAAVSAGFAHTCALLTSGAVRCWGQNTSSQLGDGTTERRTSPRELSGLTGVAAISAGTNHTCALTEAGAVSCWGANGAGALGDGTITHRSEPVGVLGLSSGVAEISAGGAHSCARLTTGAVRCWGANSAGQLGDTTITYRPTSVAVVGLSSGVVEIEAGSSHTCAVLSTGAARCWGNGVLVGDGTHVQRTEPVDVVGLSSGVAGISAGFLHSCAVLASGGAHCWGRNMDGKLGDGTTVNSLVPVAVLPPP